MRSLEYRSIPHPNEHYVYLGRLVCKVSIKIHGAVQIWVVCEFQQQTTITHVLWAWFKLRDKFLLVSCACVSLGK